MVFFLNEPNVMTLMLVAEKAVGEENDSLPEENVPGEDTFVEEDCTTGKLIDFIAFEFIDNDSVLLL